MLNITLEKFGYPGTLIKNYQNWQLLLRPQQPTLGALILICKEDVHHYSEISSAAADEQKHIIFEIESVLKKRFDYSKINYLMLMMVDPVVHFHIIPRYEHPLIFCDKVFADSAWPGPPNLATDLALDSIYQSELLATLKADFHQFEPAAQTTAEK